MNLNKFKNKVSEIDKIIPKNRWFEIPIEYKYFRYFKYPGLYALFNRKKIIYIGISSDIGRRVESHIENKAFKNIHKIKIKASSLEKSFIEYIEKRLIQRLKPICNKQIISKITLKCVREYLLRQ